MSHLSQSYDPNVGQDIPLVPGMAILAGWTVASSLLAASILGFNHYNGSPHSNVSVGNCYQTGATRPMGQPTVICLKAPRK
jgi:hypothetical protein